MAPLGAAGRGRRSAFAAAFFSCIFPGLGHAYLGRYGRALAWAALPVLVIALVAGFLYDERTRMGFVVQFTSPSWLMGALIGLALDFVYRAAAAVDAYRLARAGDRPGSSAALRVLSMAGLLATILVLGLVHVAAARPVYLTYDLLTSLNSGDEDPIVEPQETDPPQTLPPETPAPETAAPPPETQAPATPAPTAEPTGTPVPTPSRGPEWNGTERLNILLIGADRREGEERTETYLTDTLMVASIDPVTKRIALISIPRDMEGVPLPRDWPAHDFYGGAFPGKINTLYVAARPRADLFPGGANQRGFTAVKGALSELYGLDVRYYIAVDLNGFRTVVDRLGGVIIDVQVPVADDHYGTNDGRGHINLYIPAGIRHMDGGEALAYARARHQTSDFDRAARQQNVVVALRQQTDLSSLLAPGVLEGLFQAFKEAIKTDIPPELFPRLVSLAQEVDLERRVSLVLTPPTYGTECWPCPPDGRYVLTANVPAIRRAVQEVFETDPEEEARRAELATEAALVHVVNGSTDPGLASRVADQLDALGVNAIVPPVDGGRADRTTYTEPVITVYDDAAESIPETIEYLEELLGVSAVEATDAAQTAPVVVIVGSDTPDLVPAE